MDASADAVPVRFPLCARCDGRDESKTGSMKRAKQAKKKKAAAY